MQSTQELDELTASVELLGTGQRTAPLSVDLRDETTSKLAGLERGLSGNFNDFRDGRGSDPIWAATYMEGQRRPSSSRNGISVNVRTAQGGPKKNMSFSMKPESSVYDLQEKVAKKTEISRDEFFLQHNKTRLEGCRPLRHYNLNSNSEVIQRMNKNRGG